jgi:predicted O-methyltransferase YrrM
MDKTIGSLKGKVMSQTVNESNVVGKDSIMSTLELLLPKIHGWCSIEKADRLVSLILEQKPDLCVEIGVFGGSSLIPQALALKRNGKGMIFGIDPWSKDAALEEMIAPEHREWWAGINLDEIMQHCQDHIRTIGVGQHVSLLRGKAEDVVDQFKDESIDVLHIDGNHSESLAYKDATLWLPKVKPGGHIFFDDIWWAEAAKPGEQPKETTRKAIVFLLDKCERINLVKDCMVLRKN